MKFLFLMDPLETIKMEKDTSFVLMLGAHKKKHQIFFLPEGSIHSVNNRFQFSVTSVKPQLNKKAPFLIGEHRVLNDRDVDAIFIRTDPPFAEEYLLHTWLLDRLPSHIFLINRPSGIRTVNEKIWGSQFQNFIPKTCISRSKEILLNFISNQKDVIAKPVNSFGGQSVFRVRQGDTNTNVILETLTQSYNKTIILQEYLADSNKGDKRILLLNGEPLGALLRVHGKDDHRNNLFAGGKAKKTNITKKELLIIAHLKPLLRELGLFFVGLDFIGDQLIEVNVTSPTGMQEMNRLNHLHLEDRVIDFVEKCVEDSKAKVKIQH